MLIITITIFRIDALKVFLQARAAEFKNLSRIEKLNDNISATTTRSRNRRFMEFNCSATGYFSIPDDCRSFSICNDELIATHMWCSVGLYFDPVTNVCNYPSFVNCSL